MKILTSQVAMHLEPKFRAKLFSQIDALHDLSEWDPDDKPVQKFSFSTFLRMVLHIKPERHFSLGLTHTGNLIAVWLDGKDRLTIEFLANDVVKWVLSRSVEGDIERSAGQGTLLRLLSYLAPFHPESWFFTQK